MIGLKLLEASEFSLTYWIAVCVLNTGVTNASPILQICSSGHNGCLGRFLRELYERDQKIFEVTYQIRGRVFHPISKHGGVGKKKKRAHSTFFKTSFKVGMMQC